MTSNAAMRRQRERARAERGQRRRRHAWAAGAVAVSIAIHLLLVWWLPPVALPGRAPDLSERLLRPLRVGEVRPEPEPPAPAERMPPRVQEARELRTRVGAEGAGAAAGAGLSFPAGAAESALEPRQVGAGVLMAERASLLAPPEPPAARWEPRQALLQIEHTRVPQPLPELPRRFIAETPRVAMANDYVSPAESREAVAGASPSTNIWELFGPGPLGWGGARVVGGAPASPLARPETPARPALSVPGAVLPAAPTGSVYHALEKYLKVSAVVHRPAGEHGSTYVRIMIERAGPAALPVLPRDMLFVQDCSASMTEQKLHFCRDGWGLALRRLRSDDRFNVVAFRDRDQRCFPTWAAVDPETILKAEIFVDAMRAEGNTDIYRSLRALLDLPREPGRPVIAIVVSDGVPTVGVTDSSRVIGQLTADNAGAMSIYTLGTYSGVNTYLLDLLSSCNRGDVAVVTTGRWDIPAALDARAAEVGRPLLTDLHVRFAGAGLGDAFYPEWPMNLYQDRPLRLYGRVPHDTRRLVFQVQGRAGGIRCDMVFDVDLAAAPDAGPPVREQWAWQRAYALIGEHTRSRDAGTARALRDLEKAYGIRVPYLKEVGE